MKTLEELREEIDEIDTELHELLTRRIKIGQEVAKAKKVRPKNLRSGTTEDTSTPDSQIEYNTNHCTRYGSDHHLASNYWILHVRISRKPMGPILISKHFGTI